jgi:hypothetical protein
MSFSKCWLSAVAIALAGSALAGVPSITSASLNSAGTQLTITGTNLLGPTGAGVQSVTLAGNSLYVTSATATTIVANNYATLTDGSYVLSVVFLGTPTSDVTFTMVVGPTTRLLFQYLNGSYINRLTVTNISLDQTTGSVPILATCSIYFNGAAADGGFPTPSIVDFGPGESFTFSLDPFAGLGYAVATCTGRVVGTLTLNDPTTFAILSTIPAVINPN